MSRRGLLSAAGMPIRQRGTVFGLTLVAIPVLEKAMATQARRSAGPHSADTIRLLGVCHSSQAWPKLRHLGQKWPTSTRAHKQTYIIALAYIWLIAIINKTYGCLKSNHWGNGPVNDLTPQSIAHGCWITETFPIVYPTCLQAIFPSAVIIRSIFKLNSLLCFHMFIISYQQPQGKICLKWEKKQRSN